MGTGTQAIWTGSSALLLVPRGGEVTAKPLTVAMAETTGGTYLYRSASPIVSGEEQEWASLLGAERKALAKRRVKPATVRKAIKEVRYSR